MMDKMSTKVLLKNVDMLYVNQINAQIKITEAWKWSKDPENPLKFTTVANDCATRSVTKGDLVEFGKSDLVKSSFLSDASKAWNNTPSSIKDCSTIWAAKKAIKEFVKNLPV